MEGKGAKIDDVAVKGPDMPSGDLKKPKKSLFGGIGGMFGSGKGKMEVSVGNSSTCFTLFFFFLVHEARDELVYDRLGVSWTGVFLFFHGENYPNPVFFLLLGCVRLSLVCFVILCVVFFRYRDCTFLGMPIAFRIQLVLEP